jgi:hypothetical protein
VESNSYFFIIRNKKNEINHNQFNFKSNYSIRFHTCQGASDTSGWCGPGMSFDTDNQRCDMALAINCKDGDRPDWKPPDNC